MANEFQSIKSGQGLLKNEYGADPISDSQTDVSRALKKRVKNMALKTKARNDAPIDEENSEA